MVLGYVWGGGGNGGHFKTLSFMYLLLVSHVKSSITYEEISNNPTSLWILCSCVIYFNTIIGLFVASGVIFH